MLRHMFPALVLLTLAACTNREAACISAAQDPVRALDAQIAALDAKLVAGEIDNRRAGVLQLAELQAARGRAALIAEARIKECRAGETRGL